MSDKPTDNNLHGIALILAGTFVLSIEDAGSKFLVEANYPPVQIIALNAFIIVATLLLWSVSTKHKRAVGIGIFKTNHLKLHMVRSVLSIGTGLCFLYSLKFFKLAEVSVLFFSAPIFMTALSAFMLKEKVGPVRWSAVLFGFLGVLYALQPGSGPGSSTLDWHVLIPIFGSFIYALRAVMVRLMTGIESAAQIIFHQRLGVLVLATGPMIYFWTPMTPLHGWVLFGLSFLLLAAHILITKAMLLASLSLISPFEYSSLLWTAILGYVFWDEMPSENMWVGAIVIIGAGLVMTYREALHKRRATFDQGTPN